jgi:hypothetical protein
MSSANAGVAKVKAIANAASGTVFVNELDVSCLIAPSM